MEKYRQLIKEELKNKGLKVSDVRITSFDLPNYLNYCYLCNGERIQGTYIVPKNV